MGAHSSKYIENHAAKDAIAYVDTGEQHWSSAVSNNRYKEAKLNAQGGSTLYIRNLKALRRLKDGNSDTYDSVAERLGEGGVQGLIDEVVYKSAFEIAASQKKPDEYDVGEYNPVRAIDMLAGGKLEHAFTYEGDYNAAKFGIRAFLECETLADSKTTGPLWNMKTRRGTNCPNGDVKMANLSEIKNGVGQRVMDENTAHVKVGAADKAYKAGEKVSVGSDVSVEINGSTYKLHTTNDIQFIATKAYQAGEDMGEIYISGVDPRVVGLQKLQDAVNTAEGKMFNSHLAWANATAQVAAVALPGVGTGPAVLGGVGVNLGVLKPIEAAEMKEAAEKDKERADYLEKEVAQNMKGGGKTNTQRDWHTGAHCDPQREYNKDNNQGCAPMSKMIHMNEMVQLPINEYGRRILPDNDKPVNRRSNKPPTPPAPPLPAVRPDPAPRDFNKVPVSEGEIFTVGVIGLTGLGVAAAVAVAAR